MAAQFRSDVKCVIILMLTDKQTASVAERMIDAELQATKDSLPMTGSSHQHCARPKPRLFGGTKCTSSSKLSACDPTAVHVLIQL